MGCAQGWAAQVEAWSKATRPLRRTALMLMMRALCGFRNPLTKHCLALQGRLRALRVFMMLAGWAKPAIDWEMAAKRVRVPNYRPPGEVPRGPVEKRGSHIKQGRRHCRSRLLLKQSLQATPGYASNSQDAFAWGPSAADLILWAAPTGGQRR